MASKKRRGLCVGFPARIGRSIIHTGVTQQFVMSKPHIGASSKST